jgi:hypothetical protein
MCLTELAGRPGMEVPRDRVELRTLLFVTEPRCLTLVVHWVHCTRQIRPKARWVIKMTAFWNIALRSVAEVDQLLRGVYCLHHQGNKRQWTRLKRRSTSRPYGTTYQKAVIFILAAMRTWNFTKWRTEYRQLSASTLCKFLCWNGIVQ